MLLMLVSNIRNGAGGGVTGYLRLKKMELKPFEAVGHWGPMNFLVIFLIKYQSYEGCLNSMISIRLSLT